MAFDILEIFQDSKNMTLPSACPAHTCDKIAAHEGHRQLLWKAVFAIPDREALTVKVFPEVRDSHSQGVFIRVLSLELIQHKWAGGKLIQNGSGFKHLNYLPFSIHISETPTVKKCFLLYQNQNFNTAI